VQESPDFLWKVEQAQALGKIPAYHTPPPLKKIKIQHFRRDRRRGASEIPKVELLRKVGRKPRECGMQ
jgi:hypothetical protein